MKKVIDLASQSLSLNFQPEINKRVLEKRTNSESTKYSLKSKRVQSQTKPKEEEVCLSIFPVTKPLQIQYKTIPCL